MEKPTLTDYIELIYTLFDRFIQETDGEIENGHYDYKHKWLIVFFMMMHFRRIFQFKTQHRWLETHPDVMEQMGMPGVPHRTTLSRRYKELACVLEAFIAFVGHYASELEETFSHQDVFEDKSLFKAQGPVWHQSDRQHNRIPEKLRHLDTDATWSKSAYHGWVYGYGLHLTCTASGFPKLAQVETAAYSEKQVVDDKEEHILTQLKPDTFIGDDAYTKAMRIRCWAKAGVTLLAPALRWKNGRYAQAYHAFLRQPHNAALLNLRKTAIEPVFDLIAQLIGATDNHKQLALQFLPNVRPCLLLATLSLQLAMIANSIWRLPFRSISYIRVAFS